VILDAAPQNTNPGVDSTLDDLFRAAEMRLR
jgi:hypothetical protein